MVGNELQCNISETTMLTLRPIGLEACLTVQSSQHELIGTLYVAATSVTHSCDKEILYYTRDFDYRVASHHMCGDVGSPGKCEYFTCSGIAHDSKLDVFAEEEELPGYNRCSTTCGCMTCNCLSCSPSCVFWRLFVRPTTDYVYHVFRCTRWTTTVDVRLKLVTGAESTETELHLHPGEIKRWNKIAVTMLTSETPLLPILAQYFISDDTKTAMIEPSPPGHFLPGTAGQLECPTHQAAESMQCKFSETVCSCSLAFTTASCLCPSGRARTFLESKSKILPVTIDDIVISRRDGTLKAELNKFSSTILQIVFQDKQLRKAVHKNQCVVIAEPLKGCFGCLSGARAEAACTAERTDLASIRCINKDGEEASTTIACSPEGSKESIHLFFSQANVDARCEAVCGKGEAQPFTLTGLLIEEVNSELRNHLGATHARVHAKMTEPSGLALPSLSLQSLMSLFSFSVAPIIVCIFTFVAMVAVCFYRYH